MKKSVALALLIIVAATPSLGMVTAAQAQEVVAAEGDMLRDVKGGRLGVVRAVFPDGSVQIIIDGRVVIVPADTLSIKDGKLYTSLKKVEVLRLD